MLCGVCSHTANIYRRLTSYQARRGLEAIRNLQKSRQRTRRSVQEPRKLNSALHKATKYCSACRITRNGRLGPSRQRIEPHPHQRVPVLQRVALRGLSRVSRPRLNSNGSGATTRGVLTRAAPATQVLRGVLQGRALLLRQALLFQGGRAAAHVLRVVRRQGGLLPVRIMLLRPRL